MSLTKYQLCCGVSIKTSNPCRNYVRIGNFCHLHKDQIKGKNKYNVPIKQTNANTLIENKYCGGVTNEGISCKIRVKNDKFCHHHKLHFLEDENIKLHSKTKGIFQCQGFNKDGERCKRIFKESKKFCHHHNDNKIAKKVLNEYSFTADSNKKPKEIFINEWIKPDILPKVKFLISNEMKKPISESDESGYIYVYKLTEENNSQFSLCKVGRSINVVSRLYQWEKKCKYIPELIDLFPNSEFSSFNKGEIESDSNRSKVKCKYVHRAERLIHLELKAKFPADNDKCNNCGTKHREWFKITHSDSSNIINGWNEIRKIIIHWLLYIEKSYGHTQL